MSKIISIIKEKKSDIFISFVFSLILRIIFLCIPIFFGKLLDSVNNNDKNIFDLVLIVSLISFLSFILSPFFIRKINKTVQDIIRGYSIYIIQEIFKKKYEFFENLNIGSIIRKVERGIIAYEKLFIFITLLFIPNIISLIIISIYVSYVTNIYILLFLFLWSILSVLLISYTVKLRRKYISAMNDTEDELGDSFAETFLAGKTIKHLNSFEKSSKLLINKYFEYSNNAAKLSFYSEILKSTQTLLLNLSTIIVMLIGIFLIFNHEKSLTIGNFVVIYTLSGIFMMNIINITEGYKEYDQFTVDKSRLDQILNIPNIRDHKSSSNNIILDEINIKIQPFTFAINSNKKIFSLKEITIPFNKKFAIIGETGEGKTTLLKILSGIIDIPEVVYLNNIDLSKMNAKEISECIVVSPQFPDFLSGSIVRSIFLDVLSPDVQSINECLAHLNLNNLLIKNIESEININNLSGGEKKRLDILRNSYSNALISIYDEPTSSIDANISKNVWEFIFNQNKNRTLICITHDESNLSNFDIIIKITKGELISINHECR